MGDGAEVVLGAAQAAPGGWLPPSKAPRGAPGLEARPPSKVVCPAGHAAMDNLSFVHMHGSNNHGSRSHDTSP